MALVKQYDTAFERLCLEYDPEFSDPESQKILERIYKRSGMLKINDEFITIEIVEGFIKITYGEVLGIDKYKETGVDYIEGNINIACLVDFFEKHKLKVQDSLVNKASLMGQTVFNRKEFIKADHDFLEKIIWKLKGLEIVNGRPSRNDEMIYIQSAEEINIYNEKKVLAYIAKNKAYLEELITDENGKRYADTSINIVYICDIVDFEDNLRCNEHVGYKTMEIPNSNYYIVISPYKMD